MRTAIIAASLALSGCAIVVNPSVNFCGSDADIIKPEPARTAEQRAPKGLRIVPSASLAERMEQIGETCDGDHDCEEQCRADLRPDEDESLCDVEA